MSLRVWLPLGGDLKNQGLDASITPTLSNAFLEGPGKISQKSLQIASGRYLTIPYIPNNEHLSIALWVKPNSPWAWCNIFSFGGSSLNRAEKGETSNTAYYWFAENPSLIQSGTQIFTLDDETNWFHLTMTVDGSQVKFYINGQLKSTSTQLNTISTVMDSGYVLFGARSVSGNQPYASYMNDVRIYDHCLTEGEVKLLAQGLVAHYPLKAPFLPNLLDGAGKWTQKNPLVRSISNSKSGYPYDSHTYHTDCTVHIERPGRYIFVLNADGTPWGHVYSDDNTTENRKYMICFRHKVENTHPVWADFKVAEDGKHYGFLNFASAGDYDLRTNLYLQSGVGDYTVKMWNMQLFEYDSYAPELFLPFFATNRTAKSLNDIYGLDECFCQDVSGYGNHAKQVGRLKISGDAKTYPTCAEFDGSSYLICGSNMKVSDTITVCCWAYMDNWAYYSQKRVLSCTDSGGWNFEPRADQSTSGLGFAITIAKQNGTSPYTYYNKYSNKAANTLSGWHFLCGVYDGYKTTFYLDNDVYSTNSLDTKYPIYYNNNNSLFIGTEAAGDPTEPQSGFEFVGKISDVRIYGTALSEETVMDIYNNSYIKQLGETAQALEFIETNEAINNNDKILYAGNFSQLNAPLSNMKIKALPDGSAWARIHNFNLEDQPHVFTDDEIGDCDKYGKYDKTSLIDNFKYNAPGQGAPANYEFMLTYPSIEKGLPKGYTQLEYIESTGTQWIDTGVTTNARWEFDIQFPDKEYPLIPQLTQNDNHIILAEGRKTNGSFRIKEDQRWRAYMAFDKNHNTGGDVCWGWGYGIGVELGYDFTSPHYISSILLDAYVDGSQSIIQAQIQGKIQGNWWNLVTLTPENFTNHVERSYEINRDGITAIKLVTINTTKNESTGEELGIIIREMQAYGHKRQLMGYGGNAGEYWGVQQDRRYGVYTNTTLNVLAGHRDTIVHDCLESGFRLWVKDAEVTLGTQDIAGRQYQLFTIASNLGYTCNAKLYRCNCIENGKLIRQFIPARRNLDKEVGLYDLAEGVFYINNSPEPYPFLAGPEIETYQQIDYIESNGNQYINTGVGYSFNAKYELEMEYSFNRAATGAYQIMGFTGNRGMGIGITPDGSWWENTIGQTIYSIADKIYNIKWTKNGAYYERVVDGVVISSGNDGNTNQNNNGNMLLFAAHLSNSTAADGATVSYLCKTKLYSAKIKVNDIVVRDYIPVVSSSGRYGLLDRVNNQFYPSETGEFGYHQQLSYIESTGTQCFVTDVVPFEELETEIAFTPTGGLWENAIFGSAWSAEGYFLMFYHNQIRWHSGGNWVDIGSFKPGDRVVCHCTNSYITVNGNKTNIDGGANIQSYITILDNMGYGAGKGIGKIEYVKMWSGGALIRHLVPVKSSFTNRVRLYDLITKRFYDNVGTGNMLAGREIKQIPACPIEQYNRWIQISSPNSPYRDCQGYRPIHTDFVRWDGYKHGSGPITRSFDQGKAKYQINNSGDLWGFMGQKVRQGKGIHAANGTVQYETELWVRFDKAEEANICTVSEDGKCISAPHFIEY